MKKNKTVITKVKFLIEKDSDNDVVAFFPDNIEGTIHLPNGDTIIRYSCYSHIGQHSTGNMQYFSSCGEATESQFLPLKKELESIGYKLEVLNKKPPVKAGDNITIIGRRWFDRINGNTYFSAVGLINGAQVVNIPFEYGYGNHYEDRIFQELDKAGYCSDREKYSNGGSEAFWQYCNRKGIIKYVTHSDVNRKKDL